MKEITSNGSAADAFAGSAVRLSAEIVIRFSSIVATLWLTRSLGVTAFGEFILCLSFGLMIAELCDLGLNAIVVPTVVRNRGDLRTLLRMKAMATGTVAVLGAGLVPLAAFWSGLRGDVIAFTTLHFLGASWIDMAGSALRAVGRRGEEALILVVFRLSMVTLVLGAPFGTTVAGAAWAYALSVVPAALLAWARLRGEAGAARSGGSEMRALVGQAAPLGVNGYLAILSTRVELFLLQAFAGAQAVGLFGGAIRIVESLLTLPAAIAAGALPAVSRDVVQGSRGAAQRTFGLVVWIGVPAMIGLGMCAPDVMRVLGPGFVDGAPALRVLSIALLLCFANAALSHFLIAAGRTGVIPGLTALRIGVAALLGIVLIPAFGQTGAAWSFTAAELVLFATLVRATRDHADVQVLRPFAAALLACLPMMALLTFWHASLPLSILGSAALFAAATTAILQRGTEAGGLA
jgi:O-antigen/teichoic acid export membrane protein